MNTRVLYNWQPSALDAEVIRVEFEDAASAQGLELVGASESRGPDYYERHGYYEGHEKLPSQLWHSDGENILVWSNVQPTEIRGAEGLVAHEGDVVLIDNSEVEHRTPYPVVKNRWFVRAIVSQTEVENAMSENSNRARDIRERAEKDAQFIEQLDRPFKPHEVIGDDGLVSLQVSESVRRVPIHQPETVAEAKQMGGYVAPGLRP